MRSDLLPARAAAAFCALAVAAAQSRGPLLRQYQQKPGFQWKCEKLAQVDFCYPFKLAPSIVDSTERDIERTLGEELDLAGASQYAPRIHIFLVESYGRLRELVGAYAAGASEPGEHIVSYVLGHPEALTHELNHEVMTELWGRSEPWIAEGLAAYVTDPAKVDRQFRGVLDSGKAIPLGRMVNPKWTASTYPSTVIYPELGSFVKYLRDTFGMVRLREVWRGGSAAIRRVFGKSLEDLERDWRAATGRE
jgi:hypothetical protein